MGNQAKNSVGRPMTPEQKRVTTSVQKFIGKADGEFTVRDISKRTRQPRGRITRALNRFAEAGMIEHTGDRAEGRGRPARVFVKTS